MEKSIALACCASGALIASTAAKPIKIFFFILFLTIRTSNYSMITEVSSSPNIKVVP
jgi:hypothetical protein